MRFVKMQYKSQFHLRLDKLGFIGVRGEFLDRTLFNIY